MQSMGFSLDQIIDAYWVDVEALKMLEDTNASRIQHPDAQMLYFSNI